MQLENEGVQILLQRALGQILFYPPNVAGWPGGKTWIDSSTLMLRLRMPQLIKDDDTLYITPKEDDDVQMGMQNSDDSNDKKSFRSAGFKITANIDWNKYIRQFDEVNDKDLYGTLEAVVLQTGKGSINKSVIEANFSVKNKEEYIKSATIALMSTPEYQLC